jgi:hypothetical protein
MRMAQRHLLHSFGEAGEGAELRGADEVHDRCLDKVPYRASLKAEEDSTILSPSQPSCKCARSHALH